MINWCAEVKKMPKIRTIKLTSDEKTELKDVRNKHPKAYMRERAAVTLKINNQPPQSGRY